MNAGAAGVDRTEIADCCGVDIAAAADDDGGAGAGAGADEVGMIQIASWMDIRSRTVKGSECQDRKNQVGSFC